MTPEQEHIKRLIEALELVRSQYNVIWGCKNGHQWSVGKMNEVIINAIKMGSETTHPNN